MRVRTPFQMDLKTKPMSWWRHEMEIFPPYWPFVREIHRAPVNSPHTGQRRGALMFYLICTWINGWVNNREAADLRRHRAHYDVIVMVARQISWMLMIWHRMETMYQQTLYPPSPEYFRLCMGGINFDHLFYQTQKVVWVTVSYYTTNR